MLQRRNIFQGSSSNKMRGNHSGGRPSALAGGGDALHNHLRRAASAASRGGSGASTPLEHIFEADPDYATALGGGQAGANIPLIDQVAMTQ